jgi:hypothetical protein
MYLKLKDYSYSFAAKKKCDEGDWKKGAALYELAIEG